MQRENCEAAPAKAFARPRTGRCNIRSTRLSIQLQDWSLATVPQRPGHSGGCRRQTPLFGARMSVLLETSAGDLVIDLLLDEAPKACLNFLKLCKCKYYNFSPIFNLQAPSFFQSGDPNYPIGDGGSSCWGLADPGMTLFEPGVTRLTHERGTISMVCSSRGLCGSQFFLSLGPNESFDGKHAIFGRLAEGFETLDRIAAQPVDETFRPLRDLRIKHTIVLEDPFEDPAGFVGEPPESPLPTALQLSTVRIAFDEDVEEVGTFEEIEAQKRQREAEASALTLETLGDLPFASVRPPENILFVCKLNPVTSSDDLSLIFGRFGKILSCQIVKDARTGDSLQYAFVEYDLKEDAERAYFKMQGVLIDDRRIHVDFSQSVAKTPKHEHGSIGRGSSRKWPRNQNKSYGEHDDDDDGRTYASSRDTAGRGEYGLVFEDEHDGKGQGRKRADHHSRDRRERRRARSGKADNDDDRRRRSSDRHHRSRNRGDDRDSRRRSRSRERRRSRSHDRRRRGRESP